MKIPITILFEDQDIIIIHKGANLVVNRADSTKNKTVQDWMSAKIYQPAGSKDIDWQESKDFWQSLVPSDFQAKFGTPAEIFQQRNGIVHRLDKDTSGILLLAKNPGSLVNLLAQFRQRQVKKKYQCLVHGQLSLKNGVINVPIARAQQDRKKFAIDINGREAVTSYQVLNKFNFDQVKELLLSIAEGKRPSFIPDFKPIFIKNLKQVFTQEEKKILQKNMNIYQAGLSIVECQPLTGRTHQIRVHLKHLGHPIVGDRLYTGKKRVKIDSLWCQSLFLHAGEIEFRHPRSQKIIKIID